MRNAGAAPPGGLAASRSSLAVDSPGQEPKAVLATMGEPRLPECRSGPAGLEFAGGSPTLTVMRPMDMTPFEAELAIRWDDGSESFVALETLRKFCPCASCMGEKDIFGTTYKPPERPYAANAFQLTRLAAVGGYGVQPAWADGHGTGIYSWEYLRRLAGGSPA